LSSKQIYLLLDKRRRLLNDALLEDIEVIEDNPQAAAHYDSDIESENGSTLTQINIEKAGASPSSPTLASSSKHQQQYSEVQSCTPYHRSLPQD